MVLLFDYFSLKWCELDWTSWIRINAGRYERRTIPNSQGVYRIRPQGQDFLVYIGQTNHLKRRTGMLALNSYKNEMPWNDPHTAAPNLWAWRQEKDWEYEVSVASTPELTRQNREGLECLLLWKYRLENGESTFCNHGRFNPNYTKSSDKARGKKGRKLLLNKPRNPAWGPSYLPLKPSGTYESIDWMELVWTEFMGFNDLKNVPNLPGIYKIVEVKNNELFYIGETKNLKNRLKTHKKKFPTEVFSYCKLSNRVPRYQRLEIENDLIGQYYDTTGKAPAFQFKK